MLASMFSPQKVGLYSLSLQGYVSEFMLHENKLTSQLHFSNLFLKIEFI